MQPAELEYDKKMGLNIDPKGTKMKPKVGFRKLILRVLEGDRKLGRILEGFFFSKGSLGAVLGFFFGFWAVLGSFFVFLNQFCFFFLKVYVPPFI